MTGSSRVRPGLSRAAVLVAGLGLAVGLLPAALEAQYFGRNKVQYQEFDFQILRTEHFDIHYYPEAEEAIHDAARMAERWYARLSRVFNHEFTEVKPIILYANHPDFRQTNVTGQAIGEGTGGFAESLKNRIVMPLTGVYGDTDHILGHEIVHAFQYDIAQRSGAMSQQGLGSLPLWLIEGMAEYLSLGRHDPNTAMWLRDAALRGDLPTFRQLTQDPRFFPYRYGQALWAYIGGRWGDRAVTDLYKAALREGWDPAVRRVLRVSSAELNDAWMASIRSTYLPLMAGKERPEEIATPVVHRDMHGGRMNTGPSISPDGRWIAYFSERDLFEITLFLADARTGEVVRRLMSAQSDVHMDALTFLSSAGAWSPDGSRMAFVVFARGNEELAILDVESQRVIRRIGLAGVGSVATPSWSPDGRTIAVSGNSGGVTDLYVIDVETDQVRQLTDDRFAALQPTWSPDGRTLAFVTDRFGTDLETLEYGNLRLALIDVETRQIQPVELFPDGKHIDPKFSPDGQWLYFVSDADGFTDVYRTALGSGEIQRITRLATGVSGVTTTSPALTMATRTGDIMFSVFSEGNQAIYRMDAHEVEARVSPVTERFAGIQPAGVLPPVEGVDRGIVASYLEDPFRGLPDLDEFQLEPYRARLSLDYVGVPTVGVAADRFGTSIGGSVMTFWSDMLGDRQLFAVIAANGGVKDIGGQAFYQNRAGRWNWGVIGGHVPYQLQGWRWGAADPRAEVPVDTFEIQTLRIFENQAIGVLEFPLSQTRRWEFNGGYTRYAFDLEAQRIFVDPFSGAEVGHERVTLDPESVLGPGQADAVHMGRASVAYVGDWSNFGFTSPVRGGRFRLEAAPTVGTLNVVNALADYRRYFWRYPFTLAVRGLHYGRYGPDADEAHPLFNQQLFLGFPTLVRGYQYQSFTNRECVDAAGARDPNCRVLSRMFGSRIAVANAEVRVPLFGVPEYGLINFPFLPTELSAFVDAGLAWTGDESPTFDWDNPVARTPVVSAGLSTRVNLMGFAVLEMYYAYPFQRPHQGFHFGFNLAPGW
jgi:Tol biopolymer transport system component